VACAAPVARSVGGLGVRGAAAFTISSSRERISEIYSRWRLFLVLLSTEAGGPARRPGGAATSWKTLFQTHLKISVLPMHWSMRTTLLYNELSYLDILCMYRP